MNRQAVARELCSDAPRSAVAGEPAETSERLCVARPDRHVPDRRLPSLDRVSCLATEVGAEQRCAGEASVYQPDVCLVRLRLLIAHDEEGVEAAPGPHHPQRLGHEPAGMCPSAQDRALDHDRVPLHELVPSEQLRRAEVHAELEAAQEQLGVTIAIVLAQPFRGELLRLEEDRELVRPHVQDAHVRLFPHHVARGDEVRIVRGQVAIVLSAGLIGLGR